MSRRLALLTASLLAATGLSTAPALAEDAPAALPLGISSFRAVLVDRAHDHVLVSSGASIAVTKLDGSSLQQVPDLPGASSMALSADGALVYVLLPLADAISALDATTLTEVHRYAVPTGLCLSGLAVVGARVWFGYGCQDDVGNLGVLLPATSGVTLAKAHSGLFRGGPMLRSQGSLLAAAVRSTFPGALRILDVSSGSAVLTASRELGSPLQDWALSHDGTRVLTSVAKAPVVQAYSTSDLSPGATITDAFNNVSALAESATGEVAVGGYAMAGSMVTLHRADGSAGRPMPKVSVLLGGIGFSDDGTTLAVVAYSPGSNDYVLYVQDRPDRVQTSLTITGPASPRALTAFSIKGTLGSTATLPAGLTISATRHGQYGDDDTVVPVQTSADGTFTLSDTTPKRGTHVYTISFAGDDTLAPTTTTLSVNVLGALPKVTFLTGVGPYPYDTVVTAVVHLSTGAGHQVHIYLGTGASNPDDGSAGLISITKTDANGDARTRVRLQRRMVITTLTDQDTVYDRVKNVGIVHTVAKVTSTMELGAGRSGSYTLYHRGNAPAVGVRIQADGVDRAGDCIGFVAQRYGGGAWHTVDVASCLRYNNNSTVQAYYNGTTAVGQKYRFRSDFKGDFENTKASSPWAYAQIIA